jgi:hypothetical protein
VHILFPNLTLFSRASAYDASLEAITPYGLAQLHSTMTPVLPRRSSHVGPIGASLEVVTPVFEVQFSVVK